MGDQTGRTGAEPPDADGAGHPVAGSRSWFVRISDMAMGAANVAATLWILFLMVLLTADVVLRNAAGAPIAGVPEMVQYSIVGIVFLQIAHTHRKGEMIRSDGVLCAIRQRRPIVGKTMDVIAQCAGFAVAGLLGYAVWPKAMRAFSRGEMEGVVGHFQLPLWPFLAIVSLGSWLLALSFLIRAVSAFRQPAAGDRSDG